MMTDINTSVRDLAVGIPQATRLFEKLGIDYCCGGNRSLKEACVAAGLDVHAVQASLENGDVVSMDAETRDFQKETLATLIEYILETHHEFTRFELDRLHALMEKVCSVHAQNHPELHLCQQVLQQLEDDLLPHMMKEERVLFPYVIALERAAGGEKLKPFATFGTVQNPVRMMSLEHDRAGDLLRTLRRLTNDYVPPADGCFSYTTLFAALEGLEKDLHRHIHLENNLLFPRAIELENSFD